MQEITLEELYEVIKWRGLSAFDGDTETTPLAVQQVLTDLNKLGYKIVKQ